jgi:hypothetical protein
MGVNLRDCGSGFFRLDGLLKKAATNRHSPTGAITALRAGSRPTGLPHPSRSAHAPAR